MKNRFGTTSAMIIQSLEGVPGPSLLAIDARGLYLTTSTFVDRPLADPNRYSAARHDVPARLAALDMDAASLFDANAHRIQETVQETRKVNPLKASKRQRRA